MSIQKRDITNNLLSKFWSRSKLTNINVDKFKTYIRGNSNDIERLHELSQLKNGISNFVKIIAKKSVPVTFSTGADSYTDFKQVVISSDLSENNFDILCGLAMHEGSHIRYTDSKFLYRTLDIDEENNKINIKAKSFDYMIDSYNQLFDVETRTLAIQKKFMVTEEDFQKLEESDKLFYSGVMKFLMNWVRLTANWVEDRRIDNLVYTDAPGYKGYYDALYNYYFLNDSISAGLKSDERRTEDFASYDFRIVNSINPDSDITALKGLSEILELIDIDNIKRIKGISEVYDITKKVLNIVLKNVDELDKEEIEKQMKDDAKKGEGDGDGEYGEIDYDNLDLSNVTFSDKEGEGKQLDMNKLSPKQLEDLKKAIEKQKELIAGNVKKEKLDESDKQNIDALSNKSLSVVPVDSSETGPTKHTTHKRQKLNDNYDGRIYNVIVLQNVSRETFFNSNIFPFSTTHAEYNTEVREGISDGKKLGRKLLVRNDERKTEFSRKPHGKIDKRLLSDIGWGSSSVFTQTLMETYTNSIMHISIDVSGSMSGHKLGQCVKLATSVAVAADMVKNLEVVVSVRGTRNSDPFISIIYDSRQDSIKKVKSLFPHLTTAGTTPEGLCFSAIQDQIEKTSGTLKSYFVNLSDGEPYFSSYSGIPAMEHTKHEIHKMSLKNVKIISYYIENSNYWGSDRENFDKMYTKYASYVDVNSISHIARSLNKLFLER